MKDWANQIKKNQTGLVATNLVKQPVQSKLAMLLADNRPRSVLQKKENNTGLPDKLKSGIENLSGYSMDDVKVHYNSSKPAAVNAHAYAQGTNIHIAPQQEKHLPHEAWHVVQQAMGRVSPTRLMNQGVAINDNDSLEKEAALMGSKALTETSTFNETDPATASMPGKPAAIRSANGFSLTGYRNINLSDQSSIQRMGIGNVDFTRLHDMLWNDAEGLASLRILDRVNLFYCTAITYTDPVTHVATPDPGTLGITFPHEQPPMIVINLTPHADTDQLAHTIFHEARHAFDPTPPRNDNSLAAKNLDINNEIATWIRELNFSIRARGPEFNRNVAKGDIIPDGHGGFIVDPNLRGRVIANYQAGYLGLNRTDRFTVANYNFAGLAPLQIPRRGFGSKAAGALGSVYDRLPSAATVIGVGLGLGAIATAAYFATRKQTGQ